MWNNGNGQGNGNYGQQAPAQGYGYDPYDRMNNAREQGGARFPFIEQGKHLLCLAVLEKFSHRKDGPSARVIYEVLQSDKHPVGSFVVKIYKLAVPPKYESSASDSELLAQMCIALKGVKAGYPIGNDIRTLLEPAPVGRAEEQLARGTVVECVGVPNQKGNWVNLYWTSVAQTPEQIVQHRQRLEAKGIPSTGGASTQQAPQQNYGGPQGPQYAPPQQNYGQPPQQQWQPQAPQQGYTPPQQPQQQVQGPPQGGYLQQAPQGPGPQGPGPQGPQGGNGRPW